jgi:hypothetical protein
VWLPGAINAGRLSCDAAKARAHGLVTRPLEATIADVLTWDATRPRPLHRGKLGERYEVDPILPERERELVARWRGIAQVTANGGAR